MFGFVFGIAQCETTLITNNVCFRCRLFAASEDRLHGERDEYLLASLLPKSHLSRSKTQVNFMN